MKRAFIRGRSALWLLSLSLLLSLAAVGFLRAEWRSSISMRMRLAAAGAATESARLVDTTVTQQNGQERGSVTFEGGWMDLSGAAFFMASISSRLFPPLLIDGRISPVTVIFVDAATHRRLATLTFSRAAMAKETLLYPYLMLGDDRAAMSAFYRQTTSYDFDRGFWEGMTQYGDANRPSGALGPNDLPQRR